MYMTNLYAYDKKLYLIKDRLFRRNCGSIKKRAIAREDIARYSWCERSCRDRRKESFYICSLKQMKKKKKQSIRWIAYRFTRSIENKFIRCFSLHKYAILRKYFNYFVALISFNLIIIHFPWRTPLHRSSLSSLNAFFMITFSCTLNCIFEVNITRALCIYIYIHFFPQLKI